MGGVRVNPAVGWTNARLRRVAMAGLARRWKAILTTTALTVTGVAHLAIAQQFESSHVDKLHARQVAEDASIFRSGNKLYIVDGKELTK
jgi:hypothetical protein